MSGNVWKCLNPPFMTWIFDFFTQQKSDANQKIHHAVDGSEIRLTTWDVENFVNNGINYLDLLKMLGKSEKYLEDHSTY